LLSNHGSVVDETKVNKGKKRWGGDGWKTPLNENPPRKVGQLPPNELRKRSGKRGGGKAGKGFLKEKHSRETGRPRGKYWCKPAGEGELWAKEN